MTKILQFHQENSTCKVHFILRIFCIYFLNLFMCSALKKKNKKFLWFLPNITLPHGQSVRVSSPSQHIFCTKVRTPVVAVVGVTHVVLHGAVLGVTQVWAYTSSIACPQSLHFFFIKKKACLLKLHNFCSYVIE